MRSLLISAFLAFPLSAQTVVASNTQAVLTLPANGSACNVVVSEFPGFSPAVHDTDETLFPGSTLDTRAGNVNSGAGRVFVVGKRTAETAADGKWYSRALQANTPHYWQRTCSGPVVTTGTFSTGNIALGNTYNEPLPGDPAVAGSTIFSSTGRYAYPQFVTTNRSEKVIDPQTGALIKRFYLPGDQNTNNFPAGDHSILNGAAYGVNWVNPNNAFTDDGASAIYSAVGRDWLVLPVSATAFPLQSLEIDVKIGCSGTCVDPQQVGLSVNGVTAWPTDATAALVEHPAGTTSTFTVFGGVSNVMGEWTSVGMDPLTSTDIQSRTGRVDVDVSGNVTWDSGDWFYPGWITGSKITINSLVCTLTGLTDPRHLAINPASCALALPVSNQIYTANNFALMIRKKVANADTISVQYAKWNITQPVVPGWSSGVPHFYSNNLTTQTGTGALGYHAVFISGLPMAYWIPSTDTAEAAYLGFLMTGSSGGADGWDNQACNQDSTTMRASGLANQERFNCPALDHSGKQIVLDCTLDSTNLAGNLSISCSNLTIGSAGKDLGALAVAFTTGHGTVFDPTKFGCGISGIQNGQLMINCRRSQQDTLSWFLVFDPAKVSNAAGCVGGGSPGCVIAAMPTWANLPCRWCVMHVLFASGNGATNIAWESLKFMADTSGSLAGAGPYTMTTSTSLTSSPTIAAGVGGCPGGSVGCDNIVADGEPCNIHPGPGEGSNGTCAKNNAYQGLQNTAPGDVFVISQGAGDEEWVKVITHTSATTSLIQRGVGPPAQFGPIAKTHSGTLTLWALCTARPFLPNTDWFAAGVTWDFEHDPYGVATELLPFDATHPVPMQNGVISDGYLISTSIRAAPTTSVAMAPTFAGINGLGFVLEVLQDHPNHSQDTAPSADQNWFFDARPLSGPGPTVIDPFTHVSGQLYKVAMTAVPPGDKDNFTNSAFGSSSSYYRVLNRKLQPTWAISGTQPMVDVSGPSCAIGDTGADSYKYGVVRVAGECHADSVVGEAYLNAPYVKPRDDGTYGSVGAGDPEAALANDLAIFNSDAYMNAIVQLGYQANDSTGELGRRLTSGLMRYRLLDPNMSVKSLPNAAYVNLEGGLLMKLPPYPTPDGINRRTFVSVPVVLSGVPGGTDNAIVKFGYAENGGYCTSRAEDCYAVAATVPAQDPPPAVNTPPFLFPSDGSAGTLATVTGLACASGCTIAIPGLPEHVLYASVVYRDVSNNILRTDILDPVVVAPAAFTLPPSGSNGSVSLSGKISFTGKVNSR